MNLDEITEKGLLEFCMNAPIELIDEALKEFEPEATEGDTKNKLAHGQNQ